MSDRCYGTQASEHVVRHTPDDAAAWAAAAKDANLDRALGSALLSADPKVCAAAAAALAELGAAEVAAAALMAAESERRRRPRSRRKRSRRAREAFVTRCPDLLAHLANGMSARGAAGAALRYEAARALITLITTSTEQQEVGEACLARVCAVVIDSDLEAEQLVLLSLLGLLCSGSATHQRAVVHAGTLPRLLQLMRHPEPQIQERAVRPPASYVSLSLFGSIEGMWSDDSKQP